MSQLTNIRDAHLHLAEHGEALSMIPLADCPSLDECLQRIARAAAANPDHSVWLQAASARAEAWPERRLPTATELDAAAPRHCIIVRSFDHHAIAASTEVLKRAGISRDTPDPPGGVIVRALGTTEPTGTLLESACGLVWRVMPEPTMAQRAAFVRAALNDLSHRGIVEVHDMFTQHWLVEILAALESAGELAMRVWLYPTGEHFDHVREALARVNGKQSSHRFHLAGLKMFADGTLNSRTASMLSPFVDPIPDSPRGKALLTRDEIRGGIRRARAANVGIAVHAIGDAAVRTVLDACEAERARTQPNGPFIRIEHAQFVSEQDIHRFARLGVVASMQPCHLLTDIEAIQRYTPTLTERAFPLRDLVDSYQRAGLDPVEWLWLGSDTPVVPPEPMDNVQAAVERRRAGMPGSEMVGPSQAIPREMALSLMKAAPAALR